jgi:hypothetical protein
MCSYEWLGFSWQADGEITGAHELGTARNLSSKRTKGYSQKSLKTKFAKKWRAQGCDFRTFLTDFVSHLPQIERWG